MWLALAVIAAHLIILVTATKLLLHSPRSRAVEYQPVSLTVSVIYQPPVQESVPAPEILALPKIEPLALTQIRFEESDDDALANVEASISAPALSRFQAVNPTDFAIRAGIRSGQSSTALLVVQVSADGRANDVQIERSSGSKAVDASAIDYALELKWIPGTRNHVRKAMRVKLPVTLSVPIANEGQR